MAIVLYFLVYFSPPYGATHLQPGLAVELCHFPANGVVDNNDISRAVRVSLGFLTRDIVEVVVIGEVKEQVISAFRRHCNRKDALMEITCRRSYCDDVTISDSREGAMASTRYWHTRNL